MTKSELIEHLINKQSHIPLSMVEVAVKQIIDHMTSSLSDGMRIEIRGFGSFSLHHRKARIGRNPKTGESVSLKEKTVPHFKPGKDLRNIINQSRLDNVAIKSTSTINGGEE